MRCKKKNKHFLFPIFFGIVWGVLICIFIIIYVFIHKDDRQYYKHAQTVVFDIAGEQYGLAGYDLQLQLSDGLTEERAPELKELIAIREYMNASVLYQLYQKNDNPEKAAYYEQKKNTALEKMGDLKYLQKGIDDYVNQQ